MDTRFSGTESPFTFRDETPDASASSVEPEHSLAEMLPTFSSGCVFFGTSFGGLGNDSGFSSLGEA